MSKKNTNPTANNNVDVNPTNDVTNDTGAKKKKPKKVY